MQQTPLSSESLTSSTAHRGDRYIYIACPWAPLGGGMFKVAEYLIESQAAQTPAHAAQLRALDTRGGGSAVFSMWVLLTALAKLVSGRVAGRLAGVHVNMALRLSLFRKSVIVIASRALGLPVVLHLHAQMEGFYDVLPTPVRRLVRWVFSLAATVVVIGPQARRFVIDELKVPPERVETVVNGVPERILPRVARLDGSPMRVLFLGNLSDLKGVSDLLNALARPGLREAKLQVSIAGGGDVEGYRAKARALGLDAIVRLEGWCEPAETARLLAAADVLVLPSYTEVLPLVVLEALANGVAVVCTPVGEIPSVLHDGADACFVAPGDVDSLAATLETLLEQPALLEQLGRNGRALYEQQFSLPRFFANVARIHQRHFGIAGQPREAMPPQELPHRS
jgi:glycosyltransferase involved in cell wall biosynthesis